MQLRNMCESNPQAVTAQITKVIHHLTSIVLFITIFLSFDVPKILIMENWIELFDLLFYKYFSIL